MADWGTSSGGGDPWGAGSGGANDHDAGGDSAAYVNWGGGAPAGEGDGFTDGNGGDGYSREDRGENGAEVGDEKCFGCGETGHRRAECPNPREMTCRFCQQTGHTRKNCPDAPPMTCENCGEEGHMRKNCENARKINRDHIADVDPEDAWKKIIQAVAERDADDAKEGVQEYIKALEGKITYRELQQALIDQSIGLWMIATERPLLSVFTNMDIQGNMGKTFTVSYRFTEKPDRPREVEGWPKDREEILARLDDAGDIVNKGLTLCSNCSELGHPAKFCPEEKRERADGPKLQCHNCGSDSHRVRDCPEPRVDKFACKNCGKSGHKVADCEEPPNPANVECRKCNEMGHFAKDCPTGGGRACRNCGQEGHMAKECDQPRNPESITCRNCEKTGHFSRECPEPKDWSKVQCSNCQEFGHTKVRCKQPPAESPDFQDRGYTETAEDDGFGGGGDDAGGASFNDGGGERRSMARLRCCVPQSLLPFVYIDYTTVPVNTVLDKSHLGFEEICE
ncbi:Fc.00g098710.m01.CDS01 [Cosmosporella sp. VM-42]